MHTNQSKCPNCGKFVEHDAGGFYDREYPYHDGAQVVQYCNEQCCDEKRAKVFLENHIQIIHIGDT